MPSNERSRLLSAAPSDAEHKHKNEFSSRSSLLAVPSIAAIAIGLLLFAYHNRIYGGGAGLTAPPLTMGTDNIIHDRKSSSIRPGSVFFDTEGEPINAHGGGFLLHEGTYYWYGEIKSGATYLPEANADWGGTRVDLAGISCYSSRDFLNWEPQGNVLPASTDESDELYRDNVAERPKVVFNARTNKFVMWLHIDSMDYGRARCGVATSDRPTGPFQYIGSFRPDGQMARDLTVFVDDDVKAYLFTSSEDNAVMHVSELSDDYLSTTGRYSRIFVGRYMEAPAVFKRRGKYYFVGSGCTAWKPNAARSAVAASIWGPWAELGNPCRGEEAETTFRSQSTYIIPVNTEEGTGGRFIFAADRWNEQNLSDSRYVWLPLSFEEGNGNPIIRWRDEWTLASPADAWPPL